MGKYLPQTGTSVMMVNSLEQDAVIALTALGISKAQAEQAIQKVIRIEPESHNLEVLIKKALKAI